MAARLDNVTTRDVRDQVIETLLDEKHKAPIVANNYDAIQRLTTNFVKYIEEQKIPVPQHLLAQLMGSDPSTKLAFVKTHLCPRVNDLEAIIRKGCVDERIELADDKVDKCVRFLRAMAEVAEQ